MIRGSDMLLTDEAWVDGVKQVAAGSPDESQSMASTSIYTPTFLLASSSSSLRTYPASVSSGLVSGDS